MTPSESPEEPHPPDARRKFFNGIIHVKAEMRLSAGGRG